MQHRLFNTALGVDQSRGLALVPAPAGPFQPETPAALQQHPAYGLTLGSLGAANRMLAVIDQDGTILATALVMTRRFFGLITFNTVLRGPHFWRPLDPEIKAAVYRLVQSTAKPWARRFMVQTPDEPQSIESITLLKDAGLRRVMTGYSTAMLDLAPAEDDLRAGLKGKWRNQLKKAEAEALSITHSAKLSSAGARWLIASEADQRKTRGYHALPSQFLDAWGTHGESLVIIVSRGQEKLAGGLFLRHGAGATYHLGLTTPVGRTINAQNLVLWQAMLALKAKGVTQLDMGGIDSGPLAGITRFKLGTGATPLELAGSWSR